jgi:hypothetical protein
MDRVAVIEAKTRGSPGSEFRLSLNHLAQRRMKALILVRPDQTQTFLELSAGRLGIYQEADAVAGPESLKVPDALIPTLAGSLGL